MQLVAKWSNYPPQLCRVDGLDLKPEQVRLRTMNFSQPWRTRGIVNVDYQVSLPDAYLLDWFSTNLPEYVEDCQAHPSSELVEQLLRTRGWPSARQIMKDAELLVPVVQFFAHDLLLEWFLDGTPSLPGYVLNSVDQVGSCPGGLRLTGTGRRADRPVAYQDI